MKKKEVVVKPEVNKVVLYPYVDRVTLKRLFRTAGLSNQDVEDVNRLYRKYINPNQPSATIGCGNCAGSLAKLYVGLRDWYDESKFESQ